MRVRILVLILFVCLYAIFSDVKAQQEVISIEKPFIAGNLSGVIIDANGESMPFVTIRRFTSDWKTEIESVETDNNGKFKFNKLSAGIYYLRISAKYFNDLEVRVKLKKNSKAKLRFELSVSN